MSLILRAAVALLALAVVVAPGARAAHHERARVLFIGNSLTYANDLPAMVATLSRGEVTTGMVAFPDVSLEDHWRKGDALRAIRRGEWTHIVLQQGPSSLPESRRALVQQSRRFAREIRKAGAEVVMYGVWPPATRRAAFADVTASYAAAAKDTGGALVAVGDGWRAAWDKDAALPLYGPDAFHPSPLGTYLGALMFVERLTGVTPPVPLAGAHGVTVERLRLVHEAAGAASTPRR